MNLDEHAKILLNTPSYEDTKQDFILDADKQLIAEFAEAIKQKDYEAFTETVQEALNKCRKDINYKAQSYERQIATIQGEIDKLDSQEARIRNHNQEVTYRTYDISQERAKLGFFDGARKKEIDAELAKWQRQEVPSELDQKRQELKGIIEEYKKPLEQWRDKLKAISFYESDAERHTATKAKQTTPQRKLQEARQMNREAQPQAPQEATERPRTQPTIKGLKEVHKPNLKPLKRL